MPAPREYDEETRARAVRMHQHRIRDLGGSKLTARRAVGTVLDINPATLRDWTDREEIDTGVRPGVTTGASDGLQALRREVAELRRANEVPETASAFFRRGGARPPTQVVVNCIDARMDRGGVEPICRVLPEHGIKITPSTSYDCVDCPVSAAELADAAQPPSARQPSSAAPSPPGRIQ